MNSRSGEKRDRGCCRATSLANELLKDNPLRGHKGADKESGENEICWSGVKKCGEGTESLSPLPPGEGDQGHWWGPPSCECISYNNGEME